MVVNAEPIPYMKNAFQYGARTAREEALLKGLNASKIQADMNKKHAGGAKTMTVPQFHTGMTTGAVNPNTLSAALNKSLTQHQANSEFDKLAKSNKIGGKRRRRTRKGGKKRGKKTIKRRH